MQVVKVYIEVGPRAGGKGAIRLTALWKKGETYGYPTWEGVSTLINPKSGRFSSPIYDSTSKEVEWDVLGPTQTFINGYNPGYGVKAIALEQVWPQHQAAVANAIKEFTEYVERELI